ncbi:MAG: type II toxin-antitoxin system RelE/ParE family toxin [Nitrospirota bacterium]
MTPIKYHEAAGVELLNEIGYLELRAKGLGRRFFAEVCRAENLIAQFPESAEEIRPGIRKCVLRKFRYSLIYSREKDSLLILAVAHHSRRPEYWVSRVRNDDKETKDSA